MALQGEAKKLYQRGLMRKRREEEKILREKEYDPLKYPVKEAWEIAVLRAERSKRYAEVLPEQIGPGDLKYQEVDWQYENEGLPATRRRETYGF